MMIGCDNNNDGNELDAPNAAGGYDQVVADGQF
jgi:hypothetical protein